MKDVRLYVAVFLAAKDEHRCVIKVEAGGEHVQVCHSLGNALKCVDFKNFAIKFALHLKDLNVTMRNLKKRNAHEMDTRKQLVESSKDTVHYTLHSNPEMFQTHSISTPKRVHRTFQLLMDK